VRFGDPETQAVLALLDSPVTELLQGSATPTWRRGAAVTVVIAAAGYPGKVRSGDVIEGLDADCGPGCKIFHAGTKVENGKIVTHGGRVLTVCALGNDFADAQSRAYAAARNIHFDGMFYRRDIGYRAISRT